eukprot:TRINITY_DN5154_c0_g1_i1.p1 TRINITY_DN5154_c0_g1~~TRINITY_DN5154_c0_g1_i1.p1  ORF type:complete len:605 (-),score=155.24 TRINITY_DN5154_c0_g1_i1:181-1995(-)
MSAPAANSTQVWIWGTAAEKEDFVHPSHIPTDEATAKVRFIDGKRGPRLNRIRPAILLQTKGNLALIQENGVSKEVPKATMIPWYEGLLLLEELDVHKNDRRYMKAQWASGDLQAILDRERTKYKNLSSCMYVERKLFNSSITGLRFIDPKEDKEWAYRRDNIKGEDKSGLVEGEEANGYYKIKEVTGYLPPWEAFLHEKCGFYQDFYQVRWAHPFSDTDYSQIENGCEDAPGATWEPDECLPACLDPLRLAAKKAWLARQKESEQVRQQAASAAKRAAPEPAPEMQPKPKVAKATLRRDGKPLDPDLFRLSCGHDFKPDGADSMKDVRQGWPKAPADYPKGYGVANPPGFCFEGCDCMDDQRPQRSWETHKALGAIEHLAQQQHFVRRRGQVSKMWYFETANDATHDMTHSNAALDLQGSYCRRIAEIMKALPSKALREQKLPVRFPSLAYLQENDKDSLPLCIKARSKNGGPMPASLSLCGETGEMILKADVSESCEFIVELHASEGLVGQASCKVMPDKSFKEMPWMQATVHLVNRFNDRNNCQLDRNVRTILQERMDTIYDFRSGTVREVSLGLWMQTMSTVVRMLRSTAVAHIVPLASR